jgi:hypothetical protein
MPQPLLTMSSTSFDVYLTSGTTYPKLTQNGNFLDRKARIRPTGILSMESWHEILPKSPRERIQAIPMGWTQKYTSWTWKAWTHIQSEDNLGHDQTHDVHPIKEWSMAREDLVGGTEERTASRGRPPGPRRSRLIKPPEGPISRDDQDRPTGRRCHVEAGPGRPAKARPPGPTFYPLTPSLSVEVKHCLYSCLQPALLEITAENRP